MRELLNMLGSRAVDVGRPPCSAQDGTAPYAREEQQMRWEVLTCVMTAWARSIRLGDTHSCIGWCRAGRELEVASIWMKTICNILWLKIMFIFHNIIFKQLFSNYWFRKSWLNIVPNIYFDEIKILQQTHHMILLLFSVFFHVLKSTKNNVKFLIDLSTDGFNVFNTFCKPKI